MISGNKKGTKEWWDSLVGKNIKFKETGNYKRLSDGNPALVVKIKAYPSNFHVFKPAIIIVANIHRVDQVIQVLSTDFDIHIKKEIKIRFRCTNLQ